MPENAGITIAIATFNRAGELRRTLATLAAMRVDGIGAWEVLVVGNRCTDDTAGVVSEAARTFPGTLRFVDESRQGLSFARNRALADAAFDIVAFLDDDVDVKPQWLAALSAAWASGEYAAVGGRAYLVYPSARPKWLGPREEGYLTKVELGPARKSAQPDELFGVNVSFDRTLALGVGGFRTDLGRRGNNLAGGEEADLLERLAAAGGQLLYEPEAAVGHRVPPERLHRRWFWRRCFDGHRSVVRTWEAGEINVTAVVRAAWRVILATRDLSLAVVRRGPFSEEFFHYSAVVASRAGVLVEVVRRFAGARVQSLQVVPENVSTPVNSHL